MLAVMSASEKLAAAQALFVETLLAVLPQKAACTVSGAGGGFEAEVSYSAELDLWYAMQAQGKKCWNGFGIGQPVAGKKVSIAAEINFPTEGLNRAVSGVFAAFGCCTAAKSAAAKPCFSNTTKAKPSPQTTAANPTPSP